MRQPTTVSTPPSSEKGIFGSLTGESFSSLLRGLTLPQLTWRRYCHKTVRASEYGLGTRSTTKKASSSLHATSSVLPEIKGTLLLCRKGVSKG